MGRIPAAVAVVILLLLPLLPMPDMAEVRQPLALDQLNAAADVSVASLDVVCEHDGADHRSRHEVPIGDHQCPVCAALQQAANLLPSTGQPEPPRLQSGDCLQPGFAAIEATQRTVPAAFSPRGPPLA